MSGRAVGREGVFGKRKPVGDLAADGNPRKARNGERLHNQVAEPKAETASRRQGSREARGTGLFRRNIGLQQTLVGGEPLADAPLGASEFASQHVRGDNGERRALASKQRRTKRGVADTAWQVGMYGFMAFAHFFLFGRLLGIALTTDTMEFWFMMQIAMLFGFVTSYPVNWWLIRIGIKEKM